MITDNKAPKIGGRMPEDQALTLLKEIKNCLDFLNLERVCSIKSQGKWIHNIVADFVEMIQGWNGVYLWGMLYTHPWSGERILFVWPPNVEIDPEWFKKAKNVSQVLSIEEIE